MLAQEEQYEYETESDSGDEILAEMDKTLKAVASPKVPALTETKNSRASSTVSMKQFDHWSSNLNLDIPTIRRLSNDDQDNSKYDSLSTTDWLHDKLNSSKKAKRNGLVGAPVFLPRTSSSLDMPRPVILSRTTSLNRGASSNRKFSTTSTASYDKRPESVRHSPLITITNEYSQLQVLDSLQKSMAIPSRPSSVLPFVTDIAILSMTLGKLNTRGKYQDRLVRFDGTLFVCMSATQAKTKDLRPIIDADFLESNFTAIRQDFHEKVKQNYPPATEYPTMAKVLITKGNGSLPEPKAFQYYVPKWVIAAKDIIAVSTNIDERNPESPTSRTFRIITKNREYTFRAEASAQLARLKYLIDCVSVLANPSQKQSKTSSFIGTVNATVAHNQLLETYNHQQRVFKRALHVVVLRDPVFKQGTATIKLNRIHGLEVMQGIVLQPAETRETSYDFNAPRKSQTLSTIDSQLNEIDRELSMIRQ